MSILDRARGALTRFVARGRRGWSLVSSRRYRDEVRVGDGSDSSIVMAAIGWIMRNFPEAPVRVRQRKAGSRELDETTDAGAIAFMDLLEIPNGWYSGVLLWMATIADFWLSGNGYWLKTRDEASGGRVVAYWWVPSFVIAPKWDDQAEDSPFITHYLYKPTAIDEIRIPPTEVVHFRFGFDSDNPRLGKSPISTVLREIMTDEEAASYTASILRNLGVPGVVISPDEDVELEDDDAEAIKTQFMQQFGNDHRGEPMVLSAKAKVSVLSFSPQQMDLGTIRRIPEERVSGVIGVPAIVAGLGAGLQRSTFANYAEAREAGYEENIIPTQRILAADLRTQALVDFVDEIRSFVVDFDVSDVRVLAEDQNKLWERAGKALAGGAITLADFNRMVGLPVDKKLHDVYLRDARIVAVKVDAPEATGDEPPAPETPPGGDPGAGVPPELRGTVPVVPAAAPTNGNGNGAKPPAVPVG